MTPGWPDESIECCGLPGLYGDCRSVNCQRVMLPAPSVATWKLQMNELASVRVATPSLN